MPQNTRHRDLAEVVGSWPFMEVGSTPLVLPQTVSVKATILGMVREPVDGYDVDARSFFIWVDGVQKSITFAYGAFLPLSEVISQINAQAALSIASEDNGFLRLTSTTEGGDSSLRLETDAASTPTDVFFNLGLFSETESYAGDLAQAAHIDPDRQVAAPGQMTMAEGESFHSKAINRAVYQMAMNNDRNEGLLSKKTVGIRAQTTPAVYSKPVGDVWHNGYQFTGGTPVYIGASYPDLDNIFNVLDSNGLSYTNYREWNGIVNYTVSFSMDSELPDVQRCVISSSFGMDPSFGKAERYLVSESFTGAASVLNGVRLKILNELTSTNFTIDNTDPATGLKVPIEDEGGGENQTLAVSIFIRQFTRVQVDDVFPDEATSLAAGQNGNTGRINNVTIVKRSSHSSWHVEKGNRVVLEGADLFANPECLVGDRLEIKSGSQVNPWDNDGFYRISKIIDKETVEVVSDVDFGPVILNTGVAGGSNGSIDIEFDGKWAIDPFIRFFYGSTTLPYTQVNDGDTISIEYRVGKTIRTALEDDINVLAPPVRRDEALQEAILRLWGDSVDSIDDVLNGDNRRSMQGMNYRYNMEHYDWDDVPPGGGSDDDKHYGRHKNIRPDTIDMWYHAITQDDTRTILRGYGLTGHNTTSTSYSDSVLQVRRTDDFVTLQIDADGRMHNHALSSLGNVRYGVDLEFHEPQSYLTKANLGGTNVAGEKAIFKGTHRWYSNVETGSSDTLIGSWLEHDIELTGNSSSNRFSGLIGQRIEMNSTALNERGAIDLKFLELTGTLLKTPTNHGDNQDTVFNMYGIHIDYTLDAAYKIYNSHYGLKIEDIERSGTGSGAPAATDWAIHTGAGEIHFGDNGEINGDWIPFTDGDHSLGLVGNRWGQAFVGDNFTGTTVGVYGPRQTSSTPGPQHHVFEIIMPGGGFSGDPTGATIFDVSFAAGGDHSALLFDITGADGLISAVGTNEHGVYLDGSSLGSITAGHGGWDSDSFTNQYTWSGDGGLGLSITAGDGGRIPGDLSLTNPGANGLAGIGGWALTLEGGAGGDQYHLHDDVEECGYGGVGLIVEGGRGGDQRVGSTGLNGAGANGIEATGGRGGGALIIGGTSSGAQGGHGIVGQGGFAYLSRTGDGGEFTAGNALRAIVTGNGVTATGGNAYRTGGSGAGHNGGHGIEAFGGRSGYYSGGAGDGGAGVKATGGLGGGNLLLSEGGAGVWGIGGTTGTGTADYTGYGVIAQAGVTGGGTSKIRAAMKLVPQVQPTRGDLGDLYISTGAPKLYICTAAGNPGTWTVVGTQV